MAWTSTVTLDADREDCGTVTVVWNAGLSDEMTLGLGRWIVDASSKAAIVAAANAAKAARILQESKEVTLETVLDTALNE